MGLATSMVRAALDHKAKVAGPHFIFSAENPSHPDKDELKLSHVQVLNHLRDAGHDAHEVQGHYGAPERSIIIYGVDKNNAEQFHKLAARLGQDSSIHSTGEEHEMVFHHGESKGKKLTGKGTDWHPKKPTDFFTSLPGGTHHFTHNFNVDNQERIAKAEPQLNPEAKPTAPAAKQKPSVKLNPEHGKAIANAFHEMKHDPKHPKVKASYDALIHETGKQFQDILNSGLKISQIKPGQANPYKTSKEMHEDIKNNKHLWYFPTEQGFGSDEASSDHPLLAPSSFKHGDNHLLHNDVFRIVHDINGHHHGGESGFGPTGEHQAFLSHKKMYSPAAHGALFSETAGQNNWVNYGPHGEHNRANPGATKYAEQKAGLMPDHIVNGEWHK